MAIKRDLELLYEIGCFRYVPRMWIQFLGADFANNAEHTLRIMWTALVLARYEGATNEEKIMKMALIHDIPESRIGDTHYMSRLYNTRDHETQAMQDIVEGTKMQKEFMELWHEYEQKKSLESRIVKDADTLDVDLELIEQAANGNVLKDTFHPQRKVVYTKLYTKTAKKFWQAIYKSSPHDWHVFGKNRLTAGDWKQKK